MRYLAIDYGSRRTGLAICDLSETIVSPLAVVDSRKGLFEKIINIIKTENVEAVVVGLPLNMDDSEGPQAQLTEKFAERLKKELQIPVYLQDERLSSFAAEEKLAPAQYTRGKKKKRLDAIAAAEILEVFLQQKKTDNQTRQ
ncbi:MAG: Holliday junction resolvase RuvX [Sedimentisphaerales bacterium]|nr:Holliday junction resolvase RuvX [Sedimentisphaerales bacterium]